MAATQGHRPTPTSERFRGPATEPIGPATIGRTPMRWIIIVAVGSATGAWIAGASAGQTHGTARLVWIVLGAALTAVAVGLPLWAQRRTAMGRADALRAALTARTAMKVALEDALDPLAHLVAALADTPEAEKPRMRGEAISLAVSTAALLADEDRVRACYFSYEPGPPEQLLPERFAGRAGAPASALVEGTRSGNAALRALATNSAVYVADTADRPGWWGSPDEYRTFVAIPVRTGTVPLGLLTLDALQSTGLAGVDLALMGLLASLLAAALRS